MSVLDRAAARAARSQRIFWSKVDQSGGAFSCWPWQGHVSRYGYGTFKPGNGTGVTAPVHAHRYAYELLNGKTQAPALDHLCRNKICCNPRHLDPVTHRVNTLRGVSPAAVNALKSHCTKGHPLTGANLIVVKCAGRPDSRKCRTCANETYAAYRNRKRGRELATPEMSHVG